MPRKSRPIIYLGFNDPREHVRGTENVIRAQSQANGGVNYYVFRASRFAVFRWQGLVAVACPYNLLLALVFLRRLVHKVAKRRGIEPILHGHSYLLAMVASGARQVFTVHDGLTYLKRSFGSRFLWPFRLIELWVYWRATKIHAVSRYTWSQVFAGAIFDRKLTVIHNSLPNMERHEEEVVVPEPPPGEFLVVRSIEARANLELIIEFARACQRAGVTTSILVVGKGPLLEHFRAVQASENLGKLHFLGYVSDAMLDTLYRQARCVIMPALYGEGFGLPLIEAYSRGIPAVGSAVCAVPEVIYDTRLMFDNSVASLNAAIKAAVQIPAQEFVRHFEAKFSRTKILQKYESLYE